VKESELPTGGTAKKLEQASFRVENDECMSRYAPDSGISSGSLYPCFRANSGSVLNILKKMELDSRVPSLLEKIQGDGKSQMWYQFAQYS
jgi:hypothetical protein